MWFLYGFWTEPCTLFCNNQSETKLNLLKTVVSRREYSWFPGGPVRFILKFHCIIRNWNIGNMIKNID